MSDRPHWYQDPPRRQSFLSDFRSWGAVKTIVIVTVACFLVQIVAGWFSPHAYREITQIFGLRTYGIQDGQLSFNLLFPLQLFTYGLLHAGFSHIFWNLFLLWVYGQFIEPQMGKRAFLRLYIGGAVVGGLAQWALGFGSDEPGIMAMPTVGASAAVYAIMVMTTCRFPHQRLMLIFPPMPVPLWALLAVRIFFDINTMASGTSSAVAVAAHLGGAAFGFLWFRKGDVVGKAVDKRKLAKHAKAQEASSSDRREMDRILAQIQAGGLSSLSPGDRKFLERRSEELRKERM